MASSEPLMEGTTMPPKYTMAEMVSLAKEADLPIEKFVKASAVLENDQLRKEAGRRATLEEKEAISRYLSGMGPAAGDQQLTADDICAAAGVRRVQGTSGYATREFRRLLLTSQPTKKAA
jgi:hypothetical protein